MSNVTNSIKHERIQAAQTLLDKFPSQDAAGKALGFEGRATSGNWLRIGLPIRVVLLADQLGYLRKEDAVPSIPDWQGYEMHHADFVAKQLDKIIKAETMREEQAGMLSDVLRPVIRLEIGHALQILGIINDSNKKVFVEGGFMDDDENGEAEELDSLLE